VGFFYFCQRNKWIADNPATGLSRIKADIRPAMPFTPDEFTRIVQACEKFGKTEMQRLRLRAFVWLLRWSGLAIRDAVTLERAALTDDDRLILRRAKTGVAVALPLQPQVALCLRRMVENDNPRYFFWSGNGLPKSAVADWQRSLRRLFEIADLKHADGTKKRCHAHMFRHTFSIEMLLKGVPIEDVARLLGHSSIRTTEKYYASWVKARADRLEESVKAAW
jgi:integrase